MKYSISISARCFCNSLVWLGLNQAHHLRCLNDFVEAQTTYYAQCYQYMVDLQKQLGR